MLASCNNNNLDVLFYIITLTFLKSHKCLTFNLIFKDADLLTFSSVYLYSMTNNDNVKVEMASWLMLVNSAC